MTSVNEVNHIWPGGPARVRQDIADYLSMAVPPVIDGLRSQWELDDIELPDIESYKTGEPLSALGWNEDTTCVVSMTSARNMQTSGYDEIGAAEQQTLYAVRVYVYVKAGNGETNSDEPGEEAYYRSIRIRDLLGTAVRSALLLNPALGQPDFELRASTLSEQYSDVQKGRGDRWICGLYHEFDLRVQEQVVQTQIATVLTPVIYVETLGIEP